MAYVAITGNTYPVKDQLKALGGKWDPAMKVWKVPEAKADEARKLVGSPTTVARAPYRSNWRPCGYPGCNPSYCDECDGDGASYGHYRRY